MSVGAWATGETIDSHVAAYTGVDDSNGVAAAWKSYYTDSITYNGSPTTKATLAVNGGRIRKYVQQVVNETEYGNLAAQQYFIAKFPYSEINRNIGSGYYISARFSTDSSDEITGFVGNYCPVDGYSMWLTIPCGENFSDEFDTFLSTSYASTITISQDAPQTLNLAAYTNQLCGHTEGRDFYYIGFATSGDVAGKTVTIDLLNYGGTNSPAVDSGTLITSCSYTFQAPPVAQIGDTQYATLAEAIAAAKANGGTLEILQDIDLNGAYWTPVELNKDLIIDGNGHTISNFKVTNYLLAGDPTAEPDSGFGASYYCGFISKNKAALTINNLTFDNAFVDMAPKEGTSGSSILSVVVADNEGTLVYNNVNVKNSEVKGYSKVGLLQGFSQNGGTLTANHCSIEDSTVVLEQDGTDPEGGSTGLIFGNDRNFKVKSNGIKVSNCSLTISNEIQNAYDNWTDEDGYYVGTDKDDKKTLIVASETYFKGRYTSDATTRNVPMVAEVDGYQYETLADAVAAVPANTETTITMIGDEDISFTGYALTIAKNQNVALDLNGKWIRGDCSAEGTSALIRNLGTLTIQDSSQDETGKLTIGADPTWVWDGTDDYTGSYASNLIRNEGTLVIECGTLYNGSVGSATYAIDNYNAGKVTINGGIVNTAKASAIRMFYCKGGAITVNDGVIGHYTSDEDRSYMGVQVMGGVDADVTIHGGTVDGYYSLYSNGSENSSVTVDGGTFPGFVGFASSVGPNAINISGGNFGSWCGTWGTQTGFISGGLYTEEPEPDYIADGYVVTDNTDPDTQSKYPWTVGKAVAQIGTTKYTSLEEAIAAAQDGQTVTLLADCAGNGIKAPQGKFGTGLTVDFAGFTYTVDGATVGSSGTETNGFQLLKDNKITFQNGTITSAKAKILIQNYSNLTLDKMTLTLDNPNYASAYTLSNNNGNVVINDTTINANPAGAFAFDVCRYSSYPSVNVEVKGSSVINGNVEISASGSNAKEGFSLKLTSGTMTGDIVMDASATAAMEAAPSKVSITKADAFTKDAPAGYEWVANGNGTSKLARIYVAQIGSTKYATLAEAVAAAADGDTITLLSDVALTKAIDVTKKITLNLGQYKITDASTYSEDYLIAVKRGGDLTVEGSSGEITTDTASVYCGIKMTVLGEDNIANPAKLTVNGGTIKGSSFGISGNGTRHNTEITINGGTIMGDTAIYHPQDGTLNIVGGTITGDETGIELRAGTLNVSGGTITGNGSPLAVSPNGSGTTSDGAGIAIAQHTTKKPINVNITGGTINGYSAFYESNPQNNAKEFIDLISLNISGGTFNTTNTNDVVSVVYSQDKVGFITGGTFSDDPSDYVATGYEAKQIGNTGKYVVGLKAIDTKVTVGESEVPAVQVVTDTAATSTEVNNQTVAEKIVTTTTYNKATGEEIKSEPTQIKAVAVENTSTYTATITPIDADGIATGASMSVNNDVGVAVASKEIDTTNTELMTGLEAANVAQTYQPTTTVDNAESKAESAVEIETIVAELTGKIVATADAGKVNTAADKGVDVKLTVEPTLTGASKAESDPSKTVLSYDFALYATAYEKGTSNELSKMAVSNDLIKDDQEITFYVNIPTELQGHVSAIIVKHNNVAMDGAKYELTDNGTKFKVTTTGFSPYEVEFFSSNVTSANLNNVNYVAGYTLTLNDRIDVNFYTHLTDAVVKDSNSYMEITFAGLTNGHEKQITKKISEMTTTTDGYYVFTYAVAPSEGDKAITLKLHTTNGILPIYDANGEAADNGWYTRTLNEVTKVAIDYTGDDNQSNVKNLTPLAKKLLAYNQYTQGYFAETDVVLDSRLDAPDVTAAQTALDANFVRGDVTLPSDVGYVGTTLVLDSETSIKIYLSGNVTGHSYSYSDGSDTHYLTPVKSGSSYYFKITNLDATKLNKKFAVYAGDEKIFDYSVLTWAQSLIGKSETYKKNLAAAMYEYNVAARAYFGVTD